MKRLLLLSLFAIPAFSQITTVVPYQPQVFFNTNGTILVGGKVCSYIAGTSTGLATFTDQTGTVSNAVPPNAILLDASGRPTSGGIWLSLDRAYKLVVMTAGTDNTCNTGVVIKSVDQLAGLPRYSSTAAPAAGTFVQGDFSWNTNPIANNILGWSNTVSGSPGTWVPVSSINLAGTTTFSGSVIIGSGSAITSSGSGGIMASTITPDSLAGTYRVTTDQTITAGASLNAIPGLSWTLPANTAVNLNFSCHLLYSQAVGAASDSFGIQDVTIAPTNIEADSVVYTAAGVPAAANIPTLTTTTATAFTAFTPSASATVFNAYINGLIEQPSNAATSVFQVMAQFTTNNGTIKRGSACQVF